MATIFPSRSRRVRLRLLFGLILTTLLSGLLASPASAGAAVVAFVPVQAAAFTVAPAVGAPVGRTLVLWGTGAATTTVNLPEATVRLVFSAKAESCEGLPELDVSVDDVSVFKSEIAGAGVYAVKGMWAAGPHKLSFAFLNDRLGAACDRNVKIRSVGMWTSTSGSPYSYVEQKLDLAAVSFTPVSAGVGIAPVARLYANGSFTGPLDSQAAKHLSVRLTAMACGGLPRFRLSVDGVVITEQEVPASSSVGPYGGERVYTVDRSWADGMHKVEIAYLNDLRTATCDRNLAVVSAKFYGTV